MKKNVNYEVWFVNEDRPSIMTGAKLYDLMHKSEHRYVKIAKYYEIKN